MTSKQDRETRKIELVETNNIALSIARIRNAPGYSSDQKWKRALYHAILMATESWSEQAKIREALGLP